MISLYNSTISSKRGFGSSEAVYGRSMDGKKMLLLGIFKYAGIKSNKCLDKELEYATTFLVNTKFLNLSI